MWKEDFGKEYDKWRKAKEDYEWERFGWNRNARYYAGGQRNPKMYDLWFGTDFRQNNNYTWSYCALVSVIHDKDIYNIFKDSVSEEKEMDDTKMKIILIENIAKMLDKLPVDAEVIIHSQEKDVLGYMENTIPSPKDYNSALEKLKDAKTRVKFIGFRFAGGFHPHNIAMTYDEMAYWERVKTREDDGLEVRPYTKFVPTKKKK